MKIIRIMIFLTLTLFNFYAKAQTEEVFYYPKLLQIEMGDAKTNLERVLKSMYFPNNEKNHWFVPEIVNVFDDRFVLSFKQPMNPIVFYFYDLQKYKIEVIRIRNADNSWGFELRLGTLVISVSKDKLKGWEIADYLYFFQQQQPNSKPFSSQLILFESVAAQYRSLEIKPAIVEEQRKYIVQANIANEEKKYGAAIELYEKAMEVNEISYPQAYYNMALIAAESKNYTYAIFNMKKYLMLVPDAEDARKARDKIYEWEYKIGN